MKENYIVMRKKIKGYQYFIDRNGVVYNSQNNIMKQNNNTYGYPTVGLTLDKKQKKFLISRLVAIAFIKNTNNKKEVNHKDGNKLNNLVKNLEWVTHQENIKHAYISGLIKKKAAPNSYKH